MALWDSADLLDKCKTFAKRPTIDGDMTDAKWYSLLTLAQVYWLEQLGVHVPAFNYGAPVQMTTGDSGVTYYINNAGVPYEFTGHIEVRNGTTGPLLVCGSEFDDDVDYCIEGYKIRMPGSRARTFPNGLWARYIPIPGTIDGSIAPVLKPSHARILLVYRACILYASRGGFYDPAPYIKLENNAAFGDRNVIGDVGIIGAMKSTHFNTAGMAGGAGQGVWYRSGDLGTSGG